jgi:hypothetical protein
MEAKIFKKRIETAFSLREFIKIIFQYPSSDRAVVKRGIVVSIGEDGFEFEEIKDGLVAYSFKYIVEIKGDSENEQHL